MNIHNDINPIINIRPDKKIFARADGFPNYEWKLSSQFDVSQEIYTKLSDIYNLERTDYFQTGLMYFDTNIVEESTFDEIISLVEKYPISITNEQGILNLYFLLLIKNMKSSRHTLMESFHIFTGGLMILKRLLQNH